MPLKLFSSSLIVLLTCLQVASAQTVTQQQAATETYIPNLQLLASSDGINYGYVAEDTAMGQYRCGGTTSAQAARAARTAGDALAAIPGYGRNEGLPKYMILCSEVEAAGRAIGGIPVPPVNLLMFDISGDTDYLRRIVLHEFYHLLEYRTGSNSDSQWQSQFRQGYKNSYNGASDSSVGSGDAGFINAYSQSFPYEDRAELFTYLILDPRALRANADDMLNSKIQFIVEKANRLRGWRLSWSQ